MKTDDVLTILTLSDEDFYVEDTIKQQGLPVAYEKTVKDGIATFTIKLEQ